MTNQYEQAAIAAYTLNILRGVSRQGRLAIETARWLEEEGWSFIADAHDETSPDGKKDIGCHIANLEKFIHKRRNARPGFLQCNIDRLQDVLGLDETEASLLALAVRIKSSTPLIRFIWHVRHSRSADSLQLAALMLCCPKAVLARRLQRNGRLCKTGAIEPIRDFHRDLDDILDVSPSLCSGILQPVRKSESLHGKIIGEPAKARLLREDFSHLGEEQNFILRLVRNAVRRRSKGVNILLYGPPGTGKTEFCKTLAAQAGLPIYVVAEKDEDDREATREERLRSLRLANTLLENEGRALLIFDEMEDLIAPSSYYHSKVFLNRILEGNALPTFWTTNDIESFDKAFLRRMTFAVEMKEPPRHARRKIWERMLRQENLRLPDKEIEALIHDFDDAPAIAGNAIKAARLAGGRAAQVRFALTNARKLMKGASAEIIKEAADGNFNAAFVNTQTDLGILTERLTTPGAPKNFSFCLYGPPGTGKTAYTRHLANRLGLEVMHRRTSDLLSMYVGETERNIAAAFRKAREEGAFLIFDEADSLLHDRQNAQRSWEISQVNEMLTWMESHPLPFACTTNLMERIDAASLRRFTFKIGFDYMTGQQVATCFQDFFGRKAPPDLERLDCLAPGDFAVVRRKAAILGLQKDPDALLSLLKQEQDSKPGRANPVGFTASL